MKIRMIGVMSPLRTWVLISRSMRLPGARATAAPMTTWPVNSDEEQWRLGEAARHRALDADGLGDGVGGRQRDDRRRPGPRRRAGRWRTGLHGEAAGHRLERLGRLLGRGQRLARWPMAARGGDDDEHADDVAEDGAADRVDPLVAVLLGPDALVGHRGGDVELHVRRDGRADEGHAEQEEVLAGQEVGQQRVDPATVAPVGVAEDRRRSGRRGTPATARGRSARRSGRSRTGPAPRWRRRRSGRRCSGRRRTARGRRRCRRTPTRPGRRWRRAGRRGRRRRPAARTPRGSARPAPCR